MNFKTTFRICSAEEIAVQERQQKLYERQQITNNLLTQWHQVLKEVPNVELHIFYGWQGIDALINSECLYLFTIFLYHISFAINFFVYYFFIKSSYQIIQIYFKSSQVLL